MRSRAEGRGGRAVMLSCGLESTYSASWVNPDTCPRLALPAGITLRMSVRRGPCRGTPRTRRMTHPPYQRSFATKVPHYTHRYN